MKLITAHRILISAAIVFFLFFAVVELRRYVAEASVGTLVEAVVAALVAVGLAFYYRTLSARWPR